MTEGATALNDDFTLDEYRRRLGETVQRYPVVGYDVLAAEDLSSRRFCLLRHDIDISPARALEIAKIEAAASVSTTYTVLMTGRFYNPFEPEVREILLQIAQMGHSIGLHFDAVWHGINDEGLLAEAIVLEAANLRRLLPGVEIAMFSFHDTNEFTMNCRDRSYGGLWNAYAGVLQNECEYTSDSNGYWRFRSWSELLREDPERVYLLTHPEWWAAKPASPAERICSAIEERSRSVWRVYRKNLAASGRENRSDIADALALIAARLGPRGDDIGRLWLSGARLEATAALRHEVARRAGTSQAISASDFRSLAAALEQP